MKTILEALTYTYGVQPLLFLFWLSLDGGWLSGKRYPLSSEEFGTEDDFGRKNYIKDLLGACLRSTGNGDCDGSEIGIYCMFYKTADYWCNS